MTNILVFMTSANRLEALKMVKKLLGTHLIACANIIGPIESYFRWQNKTEKADEFLILMKSNQRLFNRLTKTVRKLHSYDVPEILAIPIVEGYQPYLEWLKASLSDLGES